VDPLKHPINLLWLLLSLTLVVAPHIPRLPVWVTLAFGTVLMWRYLLAHRQMPLPKRIWLVLLTLGAAAGIFANYGTLLGRDAGVALLIIMLGLKLLETRSARDGAIPIFIAYFLATTNFLYSQSASTGLIMLLAVMVITATLIGLNRPGSRPYPPQARLRLAGLLLLQASPILLLLFFLFPRIQGPLWGLPQDAYSATTGLSDTLSPGSINRLAGSNAVAFRVEFMKNLPKASSLYWRGPVLWQFNGKQWSAGHSDAVPLPTLEALGQPLDYNVTLEPHNKNWMFALDLPALVPPLTGMTADYTILSDAPVRSRVRYAMRSHTAYRAGLILDKEQRQRALQLPDHGNGRAVALGRSWANSGSPPGDIVRHALTQFREQPFYYTLTPPLLGPDTVDDFLFNTKRGFCEHYASSFVFLMRAAGVPARIVLGYQGGEYNPAGSYWMVRQSDAHAWAEVWLKDRGWVRIDPTAAVAPQRVEQGLTSSVGEGNAIPRLTMDEPEWLRQTRLSWDAMNNGWNQWVLGYSQERQSQLLSWIAGHDVSWKELTFTLAAGIGILFLLLAAATLRQLGATPRDPAQAAYGIFCRKLARKGLPRHPHEGPLDYAQRAAAARPEIRAPIEEISALYVGLRYGKEAQSGLRLLREKVRAFRA
jgi:transglutaminase-like putative cysteine protease